MSRFKYTFMSPAGLRKKLQSAFDGADFETVKEIFSLKRGLIQDHELELWITDKVNETRKNNDLMRWVGLLDCAIDRAGDQEILQKYYFNQLFFGSALVDGSPELVDAVFEMAKKRHVNFDFRVDEQLALYLPGAEKDQRTSDIVDILIKNGGDISKAIAINEEWARLTLANEDQQIQQVGQVLAGLIDKKEKDAAVLDENLKAANRAAAARQKKPSL